MNNLFFQLAEAGKTADNLNRVFNGIKVFHEYFSEWDNPLLTWRTKASERAIKCKYINELNNRGYQSIMLKTTSLSPQ